MSDYLFIYGTLLPGRAPSRLAAVLATLQPLGPGSMRGRLYDLGRYPGAISDPTTAGRIRGEVFGLPDARAVLKMLDAYEGYNPAQPDESLFVRAQRPVSLADGGKIRCWVYLYAQDPGKAPVVHHGDYRKLKRGGTSD